MIKDTASFLSFVSHNFCLMFTLHKKLSAANCSIVFSKQRLVQKLILAIPTVRYCRKVSSACMFRGGKNGLFLAQTNISVCMLMPCISFEKNIFSFYVRKAIEINRIWEEIEMGELQFVLSKGKITTEAARACGL